MLDLAKLLVPNAKGTQLASQTSMNEPRNSSPGNRGQSLRLAAIGVEFFSTILGLVVAGYLLDTYFNLTPWLGVIGLILGLVLGIYRLIIGLRHLDR